MKATIHLGPNYLANLEIHKKTNIEEIDILFNITQKLILEQSEENVDVKLLESSSPSYTRPVLSHDQVDKSKSTCLSIFRGTDDESKEAITSGKVKCKNSSVSFLKKNY